MPGRGREYTFTYCIRSVEKCFADVVSGQTGVRVEDVALGFPFGDQANNRRDGKPKTPNARHAAHLLGIHGDPREWHLRDHSR